MPAFAAAIAGGADLLGGYLQDDRAKKAFNKQQKLNAAGARRAVTALDFGTNLEGSQIKAANASRLAGFAGARKALDLGATAARQTVLGQGKINQANLEQSAVSRGLLGTSTGAQAFAGVGDRTTAQLSAIDQQLAQAFGDLGLQQAQTKAAGEMSLADLQQQKTEAMFNLVQSADPYAVAGKKKKHGGFFSSAAGLLDKGVNAATFGAF
jgi:hypothetical protein